MRRITAYLLALLLAFSSSVTHSGSLTLIGAGRAAAAAGGAGGALTVQAVGTVASATGGSGSTALAVTVPASAASGERLVCFGAIRSSVDTAPTMPGGWTLIGSVSGGGGSWGNGTGPSRVFAFSKTSDGTEGGSSVDLTNDRGTDSNAKTWAVIVRVSKTNSNWVAEAQVNGEDTTGGTAYSAAGGSLEQLQNDLVWTVTGWNIDEIASPDTETLTSSGVTYGTLTQRAQASGFTGNQGGFNLYSRPVTTGATSAPTFAFTFTGATPTGVTMFVRMRDST
jgi:hypothetical protein